MTMTKPMPVKPPRPIGEAIGRAVVVFLVVVLVYGLLTLGMFTTYSVASDTEETSDTYGNADVLELDIARGHVDIMTHDEDEIQIDREVTHIFDSFEPDSVTEGETLRLSSDTCDNNWGYVGIFCSASYTILVPQDTEITGHVRHGDITISGIEAAIDVESRHGNIDISDVTGNLDLASHHGSLELTGIIGNIDIDTRHGDVDATDIAGSVTVLSHHGSVNLSGGEEFVDITTRHGDLVVEDSIAQTLRLNTHHGSVNVSTTIAGPETAEIETRHGGIEVQVPGGALPYDVRTNSNSGSVDVDIATEIGSDRYLDLASHHGNIQVTH